MRVLRQLNNGGTKTTIEFGPVFKFPKVTKMNDIKLSESIGLCVFNTRGLKKLRLKK